MVEWISVKDRLPEDIIDHGPTGEGPNFVRYEVVDSLKEYLVTDGKNYAVGHWRPDAKAWDSFNFGWIEKSSMEDSPFGIGDVTQPLAPAVIDALHKAVDEMGNADSFMGYAPDLGYSFLKMIRSVV